MAELVPPISVEPSGDFLGNDGNWSALILRAGDPPQTLKVLASTQISETWLIDSAGCPSGESGCAEARGRIYYYGNSLKWGKIINTNHALEAESNLGMVNNSDSGHYGFDLLGIGRIGQGNITIGSQVVATIATNDFWVGNIGLSGRPVSTEDLGAPPGFLASLKNTNHIPSQSYGYTAGAAYKPSNASLTLGGYDDSKLTSNEIDFPLATLETRELMVELQSLVSTDTKGPPTSLLVKPILMLLDSTVPHLWLPLDTCQLFEKKYGLQYDSQLNFYFVDDDLHERLRNQIINITFSLGVPGTGTPAVDITLPYASFDLTVTSFYPGMTNSSKYFPLRQASGESQYTLGRTFFQESYLKVNYETRNFSISQVLHVPDESSNIIAMQSAQATGTGTKPTGSGLQPTPPTSITTTTPQKSPQSSGLATAAKAGIAVAVVVLALVLGGVLLFFCRRRGKEKRDRDGKLTAQHQPHELDGSGRTDHQKGALGVMEDEKDQMRIEQSEVLLMSPGSSGAHELPSHPSDPFRPGSATPGQFELASGEPDSRPELSEIVRSELSTPEPEDGIGGAALASIEGTSSPASSPSPIRSGSKRRERQKDSSESERGWSHTGSKLPSRPSLHHGRTVSSESESSFLPDLSPSDPSRPKHFRMDSLESERGGFHSTVNSHRPAHRRLQSNDSMETRLAQNSSRYFPPNSSHEQAMQALPSHGADSSLHKMSSPSLESIKSGLLSPAPLEDVDEGKRPFHRKPVPKS